MLLCRKGGLLQRRMHAEADDARKELEGSERGYCCCCQDGEDASTGRVKVELGSVAVATRIDNS